MSELACNYAVVRFLPYRETGEFVNVGVIACCPEIEFFDFRLLERRRKRVKQFFPELDEKVYRAVVAAMKRELLRHKNSAGLFTQPQPAWAAGAQAALGAFNALTRRRESLLHFTEPRLKIVSGAPGPALDELYDYFVERAFAKQPEYQETVMRRRLRDWLKQWNVSKEYRADRKIGDAEYHVVLPFVRFEGDQPVAAIKPFDLNRPEPTDVYLHGDAWIQRIRRLKQRNQLPERTIFVVQAPEDPKPKAAADEIRNGLTDAGATVVPFDADRVREQIERD